MSTILVTGVNGFLGAAVARQLVDMGVGVRGTGRSTGPIPGVPEYRSVDLTAQRGLETLVEGADCIIHAAGLAHQFQGRSDDRESFFSINASAVESLARAAAAASVAHFVLISSVSVYGSEHRVPPDEQVTCVPRGAYAESKYEGERRLLAVASETGMRATILRMATIYGEGDPGNVGRLMRWIDRGYFTWIGDGFNRKSLIHRDDAARACTDAAFRVDGHQVEIFNVCTSPVAMRDVVHGLATALHRRIPRMHIPAWIPHAVLRAASVTPASDRVATWHRTLNKWLNEEVFNGEKLFRCLGFHSTIPLEEGLRRQVAWYRKGS